MQGLLFCCGLILIGIMNISASVNTIDSVGGWDSPDISHVIDIVWAFAFVGVALISTGLILIGQFDLLPIPPETLCIIGPAFSIGLTGLLHRLASQRKD